ncbi:hypothetical protein ACP70R_005126 [Stipagrostis hirtigluma subsp. patula]
MHCVDQRPTATSMAPRMLLLLTLATILLVAGELPVPAADHRHSTGARRDEGTILPV